MNNFSSLLYRITFFAVVALLVGAHGVSGQTFSEPASTPPGGNTPTPLNVSAIDQSKDGGLTVGSNLSVLQVFLVRGGSLISTVSGNQTGLLVQYGNVGIGFNALSPTAKLDIDGQIKIRGGSPGAGKVLTSDASGLATWATPASGGVIPKLITTGNNAANTADPYAADIVIGSDANGGARHDSSIMLWSGASASRILSKGDTLHFQTWNTTTDGARIGVIPGSPSYFSGSVGIGAQNPRNLLGGPWTGALEVNGGVIAARYYDDDTSYYIDANTTSRMNSIDVLGRISAFGGGSEGGQFTLVDGDGVGGWEIDNYGSGGTEAIRFFRDRNNDNPTNGEVFTITKDNVSARSLCLGGVCNSSWPAGQTSYWSGATNDVSNATPGTVSVRSGNDRLMFYQSIGDNRMAIQTRLDGSGTPTYGGNENRLVLQPEVGEVGIGGDPWTDSKLTVHGQIVGSRLVDLDHGGYYIDPAGASNLSGPVTMNGPVGIGTANPQSQVKLEVYEGGSSANAWKGRIVSRGDSNAVVMGESNGVATLGAHNAALNSWANLVINPGGGSVGIGTAAPREKLEVAGAVRATAATIDGTVGVGMLVAGGNGILSLGPANLAGGWADQSTGSDLSGWVRVGNLKIAWKKELSIRDDRGHTATIPGFSGIVSVQCTPYDDSNRVDSSCQIQNYTLNTVKYGVSTSYHHVELLIIGF